MYTIFDGERFIYVGMGGTNIKKAPETTDLDAPTDVAAPDEPRKPKGGLWGRLRSHWGGQRSGDQFSVYVCDSVHPAGPVARGGALKRAATGLESYHRYDCVPSLCR